MAIPKWNNLVTIHTIIDHLEGDFDLMRIFLKAPIIDPRQKIEFIGTNHRFKVNHERWSTIYDLELTKESFQPPRNQARANIILNIEYERRNPYRVSNETLLSDLPSIWDENSEVKEYLETHDFVEKDSKEIQKKAMEFAEGNPGFWTTVRNIANWINTYIAYSYNLQKKEYRGALETLKSRRGTCSDFVHLFLALTRNLNIPSRAMIGLHRVRRSWEAHSWAEVFDPQYGWTPLDVVAQPTKMVLGRDYIGISAGYNCAVRFYAYYNSKEESGPPVKLEFKQYYIIGRNTIEIEFFDE